jgi:hypothetical protein
MKSRGNAYKNDFREGAPWPAFKVFGGIVLEEDFEARFV